MLAINDKSFLNGIEPLTFLHSDLMPGRIINVNHVLLDIAALCVFGGNDEHPLLLRPRGADDTA
jgi:hypothetical protein